MHKINKYASVKQKVKRRCSARWGSSALGITEGWKPMALVNKSMHSYT